MLQYIIIQQTQKSMQYNTIQQIESENIQLHYDNFEKGYFQTISHQKISNMQKLLPNHHIKQHPFIQNYTDILKDDYELMIKRVYQTTIHQNGLFKMKCRRKIKRIKIDSDLKEQYENIDKNLKNQSQELCKYIKILTLKFLMPQIPGNQLNPLQKLMIEAYAQKQCNFKAIQTLFGVERKYEYGIQILQITKDCDKIRKKCLNFYSSSKYVKQLFSLRTKNLNTKIQLIKILQNVRKSCIFPESHNNYSKKRSERQY